MVDESAVGEDRLCERAIESCDWPEVLWDTLDDVLDVE